MTTGDLALNLLGGPELVAQGVTVGLSPSAAMTCAYLALAPPEGRPRTVAAAHLFSDCTTPMARRRLNTALWRLRSELRPHVGLDPVATTDRHVALRPEVGITVDTSLFEELVRPVLRAGPTTMNADAAARLERAVVLHRGPLLETCQDEWVLGERYRLDNLYLTALDHLIQFHGSCGDVGEVNRYGELALELEPLREDLHRHLMQAYASSGRPDLVEAQFERCRMVLLDELGSDPLPETIALYARLSHGDRSPAAGVAALVAELERARRDVTRLAAAVDRALEGLRRMPT